MSVVVSDTSPLLYLIQCHASDALPKIFGEVLIPPTVLAELQHRNCPRVVTEWLRCPPGWLKIQAPKKVALSLQVDAGEREAISLADEVQAAALLIDDRRGRMAAVQQGLRVMGTIGLLEEAARRGLIDFKGAVRELRLTNARIEAALIEAAMKRLNLK